MEKEDFYAKVEEFQNLASDLAQYVKETGTPIHAKFPRGVIRTLTVLKPRWPYLEESRKRTVGCAIQLCDVNQWHMNTWSIGLTAGTLSVWQATLPVIAVIETLLREYGLQYLGLNRKSNFESTINHLRDNGVYSARQAERFHRLRKYRNGIHLYLQEKVELHDGRPKRYNEAVVALEAVERALLNHWKKAV